MGIRERKARHKEDLRRRVLVAAEAMFAREGYEHVSMRKLAAAIEYSPTTIYRLFGSKAEVMEHLVAEGYAGVRARYDAILASRPASPLAALRLVVREYVAFAVAHPNHYRLWFATSRLGLREGRLEMRHGGTSYRVYHVWLELIDDCKAASQLPPRDTLELFELIWGAVHGLISLRIHHPQFPWPPLERHVDGLLAMLDHGLSNGAAPVGAPTRVGAPGTPPADPRPRAGRRP